MFRAKFDKSFSLSRHISNNSQTTLNFHILLLTNGSLHLGEHGDPGQPTDCR